MVQNIGLSSIIGIPQVFYHQSDTLFAIIAKYVDDLIVAARNKM